MIVQDMLNYICQNPVKYWNLVKEHFVISAIVIVFAGVLGFFAALWTFRFLRLNQTVSMIFVIFRMIPSLVLLILFVPILGAGRLPAAIVLFFLALPPVFIFSSSAFHQVSSSVLEAAKGMGMNQKQIFFSVLLPLSLPSVFAGIRISAIEVISSATIASYIGAGGIGSLIITGLNLYRMDLLLLGGLTAAALALIADFLFFMLERRATAYQRK